MKIKLPSKSETTSVGKAPADIIKESYVDYKRSLNELDDAANKAFDRMFLFGQMLVEHEDSIKDTYGTWSNFASKEGIDKYAISRCRSSVLDFRDLGAGTIKQAKKMISDKGLKPTVKLLEGSVRKQLDTNPMEKTPPKDKSVKRERDINEVRKLADRITEIVDSHDPDDDLYQEAMHLKEFAESSVNHIHSLDVSQKTWNCNAFLNFCRNINYDAVLGKPVEKTEPMHIGPKGDVGSMGGKVADFYAIPGCRATHDKLHSGEIELSYEDIADLHRWTMVQFMLHYIPADKTTDEIERIPETEYEEE